MDATLRTMKLSIFKWIQNEGFEVVLRTVLAHLQC